MWLAPLLLCWWEAARRLRFACPAQLVALPRNPSLADDTPQQLHTQQTTTPNTPNSCCVSQIDPELAGGVREQAVPVQFSVLRRALGGDTVGLKLGGGNGR